MGMLNGYRDEAHEELLKEEFIRETAEELRQDSSLIGAHYRDFEAEAHEMWEHSHR